MPISVAFWQGLHLLASSDPALKRGAVQIVVLLTRFCVKPEQIIGKWELPKCVSQLLINPTRKDLGGWSRVRHGSNLGMLHLKCHMEEVKVSHPQEAQHPDRRCKRSFFLKSAKGETKPQFKTESLGSPPPLSKHEAILKSTPLINKQCLYAY